MMEFRNPRGIHKKSHYIEVTQGHIFTYGTENVIWAGFGPIGNTEKLPKKHEAAQLRHSLKNMST